MSKTDRRWPWTARRDVRVGGDVGRRCFGGLMGRWDDVRAELDDTVDGGDRVVALGRFCGRPKANGRCVEVPFALVWTMRDGRAADVAEHLDTALLIDALGPAGEAAAAG